jgi:hypothetical protein
MRKSTITTMTVAILIGALIAPVAQAAPKDQILLHRDGDRAVPFDSVVGVGEVPALRRVGSAAVPFVADIGPQTGPADSGFHWRDAMVGAGAACGLMLLGVGSVVLARRLQPRMRHGDTSTRVAAQ